MCIEGFGVCHCGGAAIEKEINASLVKDNMSNKNLLQRIKGGRLPRDFPQHVVEDLKCRAVNVLSRGQKEAYMGTEENIAKMKGKIFYVGQGKAYKEDFPYLCVSFTPAWPPWKSALEIRPLSLPTSPSPSARVSSR